MIDQTPSPGNAPGLPPGTLERLAQFVEWTGTVAPSRLLDADGAPSDELIAYSRHEGINLDWLFAGDVRGLVMRLHTLTRNHVLNTGLDDYEEDERLTVEAKIVALLLRTDLQQRQIIKRAALDRLSGKPLGDVIWRMMADLDSHRSAMTEGKAVQPS